MGQAAAKIAIARIRYEEREVRNRFEPELVVRASVTRAAPP
jgi:hypothetical protein